MLIKGQNSKYQLFYIQLSPQVISRKYLLKIALLIIMGPKYTESSVCVCVCCHMCVYTCVHTHFFLYTQSSTHPKIPMELREKNHSFLRLPLGISLKKVCDENTERENNSVSSWEHLRFNVQTSGAPLDMQSCLPPSEYQYQLPLNNKIATLHSTKCQTSHPSSQFHTSEQSQFICKLNKVPSLKPENYVNCQSEMQ